MGHGPGWIGHLRWPHCYVFVKVATSNSIHLCWVHSLGGFEKSLYTIVSLALIFLQDFLASPCAKKSISVTSRHQHHFFKWCLNPNRMFGGSLVSGVFKLDEIVIMDL